MHEEVNVSIDAEIESVSENSSSENEIFTGSTFEVGSFDYTPQFERIETIGITIIFSIGILSGLLLGKTLWEKVRLWQ